MSRKSLYIWIAIVAILSLILLLINKGKSTLSKNETIEPLIKGEVFNKISVESNKGAFIIENINNTWLIDGETEASIARISAMVTALENIQTKYPAPAEQSEKLTDTIIKSGAVISLYNKDKLVFSLKYIDLNYNTIALSLSRYPFFIEIRTNTNIPLGMIIPTDKTLWNKNLLIDVASKDIANVKLIYDFKPDDGFIIEVSDEAMELKKPDGSVLENVDMENVNDYLKFFRGINFEPRNSGKYTEDFKTSNFYLEIGLKSGKNLMLRGYDLYRAKDGVKDINIFVGIVNKLDTIYLKYSNIDPILTSRQYFLKK